MTVQYILLVITEMSVVNRELLGLKATGTLLALPPSFRLSARPFSGVLSRKRSRNPSNSKTSCSKIRHKKSESARENKR